MKIKFFLNTLCVFIAIVLFSPKSFGQSTDTLKYKFDFQIGGQRKRGVFSQTVLRATANAKIENKKLILNNQSSYTYTEANGFNIADDWHLRTIATLKLNSTTRLLPVFGYKYLKNVLYRITNTNRVFTGLRINPVRQHKDFYFVFGAGYELSHYTDEIFVNSSLVSSQRDFTLGFLNLAGKHQLRKNKILLEYDFSFVQSFEEAKDFAFWFTSGVSIPFGKHLFIGVNYDYRFRNVHLIDIPNINDLLIFNLRFNIAN